MGVAGLAAVAMGQIRISSGQWAGASGYPALSPDIYGIWRAVRETTPPDALIFTDSISEKVTLINGWNTYAAQGGRQVFLSQWMQTRSPTLKSGFLKEKFETNLALFEGRVTPPQVAVSRPFSAFYAVAEAGRAMPQGWSQVYANPEWRLYHWRGPGG